MRLVEAGSGCRCTVEVIDYEPGERYERCELGFADCTHDAVVMLRSVFWEPRLAGRYCYCCQECYEEHVPACRATFGMSEEGK